MPLGCILRKIPGTSNIAASLVLYVVAMEVRLIAPVRSPILPSGYHLPRPISIHLRRE